MIRRFAEIQKFEKSDDGTLQVFGIASTEAVDAEGETITKGAMTDAIPDFLAHGTGALRAMHQPIAAGFVTKVTVNDAGETEIEATVVDPVEILKVETGTYKGFSVGGKKLPGGYDKVTKTISKMKLTEISLVDRPCNPEAVITMFKGDDMTTETTVPASAAAAVDELAALLDAGSVTPERLVELVKAEQAAPVAAPAEPTIAPAAAEPVAKVDIAAPAEPIVAAEPVAKRHISAILAAVEGDDVRKGMYSVSRFADLLCSIGYLVSDVSWEADYEKDGSSVPAGLLDWLSNGAELFKTLAIEEIDELIASLKPTAVTTIELSEQATTLRKSLTDAAAVSLVDFLTIGKAHMSEKDIAKAVLADGFEKTTDAIVAGLSPEIAKRDTTIAKLSSELDVVKAELTALKAAPAPSNARLRVVVEKVTDGAAAPVVDEPILKRDGSVDVEATAMQEIKKVHQSGGRLLRPIN